MRLCDQHIVPADPAGNQPHVSGAREGNPLAVNANAFAQVGFFFVVLALISWPLGVYIHRAMAGPPASAESAVPWVERAIYRICRVDASMEMRWTAYAAGLLLFNAAGAVMLYLLQRMQAPRHSMF